MLVDTHFEKVQLFLSATNLPKLHTFNVTDPFCDVFIVNRKDNSLVRLGMTEQLTDTLNPVFTKSILSDYLFEEVQEIVANVYHKATGRLELIGEVRFQLSTLMCANGQTLSLPLVNPARSGVALGTLTIRAEAQANTRDLLVVTFYGTKLANKDGFFGRSDPFFEISRCNEDGT